MIKHYFDDIYANFSRLESEVSSWVGTPYQHGGWQKKISVDCVHFVGLVYVATGIISQVEPPSFYPVDWYLKGEDKIVEMVDYHLYTYRNPGIEYEEKEFGDYYPRAGDMVFLKLGKSPVCNHVGIKLLKNLFVHANSKSKKVTIESIETYASSIQKIYAFETIVEEE